MQEEFDDGGAVGIEMPLEIADGTETLVPDMLRRIGQVLAPQNLGMHPHDQHFLVVGAVEDSDLAPLGQVPRGAPQKVMRQLGRAGMLEAENLAALRIDA